MIHFSSSKNKKFRTPMTYYFFMMARVALKIFLAEMPYISSKTAGGPDRGTVGT